MATFDGSFGSDGPSFDGSVSGGGGGGGGGSSTVLLHWGCSAASVNYYIDAMGTTGDGVQTTIIQDSINVAPFAGDIDEMCLVLNTSNVNQVWAVYVNGSEVATASTPSATAYAHVAAMSSTVSVAKGDELAIKLKSGSSGNGTMIDLILVAT